MNKTIKTYNDFERIVNDLMETKIKMTCYDNYSYTNDKGTDLVIGFWGDKQGDDFYYIDINIKYADDIFPVRIAFFHNENNPLSLKLQWKMIELL